MAATKMTQTQLIRKIAESCEISNKTAKAVLETLAETAVTGNASAGTAGQQSSRAGDRCSAGDRLYYGG